MKNMHTDVRVLKVKQTVQGVCLKYDSLQALFQKRYFLIFVKILSDKRIGFSNWLLWPYSSDHSSIIFINGPVVPA